MILHLALGDSAAGCLRAACRDHGLAGEVFTIPEDPSHGPLADGIARIAYMRVCFQGVGEWQVRFEDAFEPWRTLLQLLDRRPVDTVVVWSSDSLSDAIFLRMAAHWLVGRPEKMTKVITDSSEEGRRVEVATFAPADLAARHATRQDIVAPEREALARDYAAIRDRTGTLRRWEAGRITGLPQDHYDGLVLNSCGKAWQMAARVVGNAMAHCPPRNALSDVFLGNRLQHLIEAGIVEADGPRHALQGYRVRRRCER